ncbi:pyridoxine/pyridoxamine 5'-phosphate oxidase [Microplitis demolitor]|uniref:pyridoxine/pyridoxamine 5'-phosphate oxidase n=1 Tax=Microplitis demolitor TaxID=69319 RepID=UPI0004CCA071|nr:pyridoxine/pyridoxamine 5'-phosphate oxidase [Microplitis demolitor]
MAVTDQQSDLAFIELRSDDPCDLFKDWHNEANKFTKGSTNVTCLATLAEGNTPRARNLLLRKYNRDGFEFFTDSRGKKSLELSNNSKAAMCIYWVYDSDKNERVSKQVRLEGRVELLPRDQVKEVYDAEPLYCKVRAHLCHQDTAVDWNEMKKRHDELLRQAKLDPEILSMPDHYIGYKLVPTWFDFYFSKDNFIADRIEFLKNDDGIWTNRRIAA